MYKLSAGLPVQCHIILGSTLSKKSCCSKSNIIHFNALNAQILFAIIIQINNQITKLSIRDHFNIIIIKQHHATKVNNVFSTITSFLKAVFIESIYLDVRTFYNIYQQSASSI